MLLRLKENRLVKFAVSYGSLFTSFGTLICCAIPSSLVLLGFGASLAQFLGEYPELIWFSEHKGIVFGVSFFMLGCSFLFMKNAAVCPIDKKEQCQTAKKWSRPLLYMTLGINLMGAFYAFVLPRLL